MFELYSLSKSKGIISLLRNLFSKNEKDDIDLSLFSASIKEIKKLDLEEILNEDKISIDDDTNLDKSSDVLKSDYMLKKIIKCLTEIEEIKDLIDEDQDGKINEEELNGFIEDISTNDGDEEDFSMEDISKMFEDNNINADKALKDLDKTIKDEIESKKVQEEQSYSGAYGGGGYASRGGISQTSNNESEKNEKSYSSLSLDELESEKLNEQTKLNNNKEQLVKINNLETETLKNAKEQEELAKEEYDKLLEKDMDSNPKLNNLKAEKETNENSIKNNESKISEAEIDLINKKIENTNQINLVSNLKSELTSLKSSISTLKNQQRNTEDKQRQSDINNNIISVQQQITQKNSEIQIAENKQIETQKNLENAQEKLNELKEEKKNLENIQNRIETDIQKTCSEETKKALENYNNIKETINAVKEKQLTRVNNEITKSQNAISEIDLAITKKKISKTKQENGAIDGQLAADYAWSLKGSSEEEFAKKVDKYNSYQENPKDRCEYHKDLYCGDFVYFSNLKGRGKDGLPEWYRNCINVYYPPVVDEAARNAGAAITINGPQDIHKIKPGDIITFRANSDGSGAHIGMVKSIDSNGIITTIEGNTFPNGSINSREISYDDPHIAQLSSMNL